MSSFQFDGGPDHTQTPRKKRDQLRIGAPIDGKGRQPDLQRAAMASGHFTFPCSGLSVDRHRDGVVSAVQPVDHGLEKNQGQLGKHDHDQGRQIDRTNRRQPALNGAQEGACQLQKRLA